MFTRTSMFDEMANLFRSVDTLMNRTMEENRFLPSSRMRKPLPEGKETNEEGTPWMTGYFPAVECKTREKELVFRAELPGVPPEDVEVNVEGGMLFIRGHKKAHREEKDTGWLFREFEYGRFERAFELPEGVEPDKVKATFKNGVLEILVPAPALPAAKKVPIEIGTVEKKAIKAA